MHRTTLVECPAIYLRVIHVIVIFGEQSKPHCLASFCRRLSYFAGKIYNGAYS